MSKPVLAVDIDDVLFPNAYRLIEDYNRRHGYSVQHPASINRGVLKGTLSHLEEGTGLNREVIVDQIEAILADEAYHDVDPLEGSTAAVLELSKRYQLVAITGRPLVARAHTVIWLARHYPGLLEDLHVLGKRWGHGSEVDKSGLFRELGVEIVIDDLLGHVMSAAEIGVRGLLYGDYPWNQADDLPEGVIRVRGWDEVLEELM